MNACSCMGPMYGEPYCICQMEIFDIPLNTEARAKAAAESGELLKGIFGPGGIFEAKREKSK